MKNDKSIYRYYHGLYHWISFLLQSTFHPNPWPLFLPLIKLKKSEEKNVKRPMQNGTTGSSDIM